MDGRTCDCSKPKVYGRRMKGAGRALLWCLSCNCRVADRGLPALPRRRPRLPEFRNDHGAACTCFACVVYRRAA